MNQTPTAEGLTEKQQDFYKTFGYVVLNQLYSAAELEAIRKQLYGDDVLGVVIDANRCHCSPI